MKCKKVFGSTEKRIMFSPWMHSLGYQQLPETMKSTIINLRNRKHVLCLCKTNRFHFAMRLFSNRSQRTSKCGKNKKVAHKAIAECVTDVLTTFKEYARKTCSCSQHWTPFDSNFEWKEGYQQWKFVSSVVILILGYIFGLKELPYTWLQ